jgi:hypothetical protein
VNTPRPTTQHIPLPTRSTDVRTIQECPLSWFLTLTRPDAVRPATYYGIGSAVHETIQATIERELTRDQAVGLAGAKIDGWKAQVAGQRVMQTRDRTLASMHDDAERMIRNWWG